MQAAFGERGGVRTGQQFRGVASHSQDLFESRKNPQAGAKLAKLSFLKALPAEKPVPPPPPPPSTEPPPAKRPALALPPLPPPKPPSPPASTLWTEIFRSKRSQDVLGNTKAIDKFRHWVQFRVSGKHNTQFPIVAFLSGPAGTGKTTLAANLLREYGAQVVEINASAERKKEAIAERIETICLRKSLDTGKATGLVLDEIDGTIMEDGNGAIAAILNFLKTKPAGFVAPIICICNDRSNIQIRTLAKVSFEVRFYKLHDSVLREIAKRVQQRARIFVPDSLLDSYIKCAQGDARKLINLLYLRPQQANRLRLNAGDAFSDPFATTKTLFKGTDSLPMLEHLYAQDADAMTLLCQENYPKVCDTQQECIPWSAMLSDVNVLEGGWNTTYWDPNDYAGAMVGLTARIKSKKRDLDNIEWPKFFEVKKATALKAEDLGYKKLVHKCDVRDLSLIEALLPKEE